MFKKKESQKTLLKAFILPLNKEHRQQRCKIRTELIYIPTFFQSNYKEKGEYEAP